MTKSDEDMNFFLRLDDCMAKDVIIESLQVTDEDIVRICSLPQRSDEWHVARENRITGSRVGGCIGSSEYDTPDSVLKCMLWGSDFKGNAATRRGTAMEPFAQESLLRIAKKQYSEHAELATPGLIVCKDDPIFAYSPDGILTLDHGRKVLVEIKAPFNRKPYGVTPRQYFAQIQLGMWVTSLAECLFVEYCGEGDDDDTKTYIKTIKRDDAYINDRLLPLAREFYFQRFLPLKISTYRGQLQVNRIFASKGTSRS